MKLYYMGQETLVGMVEPLAEYLGAELVILDHSPGAGQISWDDFVYVVGVPPKHLINNSQVITQAAWKYHHFWDEKGYQIEKLDIPMTRYPNKAAYIKNKSKHKNDYVIMTEFNYNPVFVREFIQHDSAVGVGLIIMDDGDVFITEPWQQIIEGTRFRGSYYPHGLSEEVVNDIKQKTADIGKVMYDDGYRGAAGIDFMLDGYKVHFCEVNGRKQYSTIGASKIMEAEYGISFAELEFMSLFEKAPTMEKIGEYEGSWSIRFNNNRYIFTEGV